MNSEQGYGSPMTSISTLRDRYKTDSVETMSPGRLIVALYERLLLDLQRGVEAIVREDVAATHASLVHAQDIDGSPFTLDVMDLEARCVSHETDHLDGELFISYLSPLKRDLVKRKIKRRIRQGEW